MSETGLLEFQITEIICSTLIMAGITVVLIVGVLIVRRLINENR